ncbi:MAG TPA: MBL fold metallo-hydrolase [Candidatus Dormibacteraeota bacterium]|nr:MBL fold metallo-hydrolase [Candidatus Dormibacteraeota bacterium]
MADPEELAPGVYRIDAVGLPGAVNVFAIRGPSGWALVDTGVRSSPKRIQRALARLGAEPATLTTIYLTHHHQDHVGGLPEMCRWAPDAEVVAPEHEAEIIAGDLAMDRSSSRLLRLLQHWNSLPVVPVSRSVGEGERIAGFRVVATPGHSLGHTSLLSDEHGLLLTGDAFGAMPRRLRVGVRRAFCADPAMALRSAEKLLEEDYRVVAFSHGPVLRDDPKARLRQVVAECGYG